MGLLKRHCGELAGLLQDCRCGDGKGCWPDAEKWENSMKNWLDGLKDESHITVRHSVIHQGEVVLSSVTEVRKPVFGGGD